MDSDPAIQSALLKKQHGEIQPDDAWQNSAYRQHEVRVTRRTILMERVAAALVALYFIGMVAVAYGFKPLGWLYGL